MRTRSGKSRAAAAALALAMALAARPGAAANEARPAGLLFWSRFEGPLKLLAPRHCYRKGCFQELVGSDSATGERWPAKLAGGDSNFQLLVDGPPPTPQTVGEYMFNDLRTVIGHDGKPTRALYSEVRQSGCCGIAPQGRRGTQNAFHIYPGAELGDVYFSKWMKFQPDLAENLRSGAPWRVVFEWKEGGGSVEGAGSFRTVLGVTYRGGKAPVWDVTWDNNANGGLPLQTFYRSYNRAVPVPIGEWFKLEVFWHRARDNRGRIWFAVNGKVIDDHSGPTIGVNNTPIGRIMINQVYSGAPYPIYQWSDDYQLWRGWPAARPGDPWYDPPYAPH